MSFGRVLALREYRFLFSAQVLSLLGDRIAAVAMSVLVFQRTHSTLLAAATYAASYLPYVLAGPVLATLADRMPRRRLMLLADVSRGALVAVMAVPAVPTAALFALLLAVTAVQPGFDAARGALIPEVFPEPGEMSVAIQLGRLVNQSSQLLGFGGGGLLLTVASPHTSLAIDAATFFASAALVRAGVRARPVPAPRQAAFLRDMLAGAALVLRDRLLRRLVLGCALLTSVLVVTEALAVAQAHALHRGSAVVGALTAAGPGGYFVALLLLGRWLAPTRQFAVLRHWAPVATLLLLVPLAHPTLPVTLVCWALAGTGNCVQQPANALFSRLVRNELRGRALGFVQLLFMASQGVAVLLAGALSEVLRPDRAVALVGALGALALAWVFLRWPGAPEQPLARPEQAALARSG